MHIIPEPRPPMDAAPLSPRPPHGARLSAPQTAPIPSADPMPAPGAPRPSRPFSARCGGAR